MAPKKKQKKRPRTLRRQAARQADALANARRKLWALDPGGARDNPIELASMSQVDGAVRALRCVACDSPLTLDHEVSVVYAGRVLRTVELSCRQCSERHTAHFALRAAPTPN